MSSLIGLAGGSTGADYYSYAVDNSCRFNDADSAKMTRAWGAAGTEETWSLSFWAKQTATGYAAYTYTFFTAYSSSSVRCHITLTSTQKIQFNDVNSGDQANLVWTPVYADCSAWGHYLFVFDTTEGTDTNRVKFFFNGVQVTALDGTPNWPDEDYVGVFNSNVSHIIGESGRGGGDSQYIQGYLSEVVFIDGVAHTPSSFGETNDDGIWVPKNVSGLTFGTKGYYLDFKVAPGTGNGAGNDVSGNNNDFTDSGLASNDQVADSPTNNWCTLNAVWKEMGDSSGTYSAGQTYRNGNLDFTATASSPNRGDMVSTMGMLANGTAGAIYYAELTIGAINAISSGGPAAGITNLFTDGGPGGVRTGGDIEWASDGTASGLTSPWLANTSLASYTTGDVLGFIVDCENNVLWVTKDGTYQTGNDSGIGSDAEVEAGDTSARNANLISGDEYHFFSRANTTSGNWLGSWNFGQHAWNTEPPSNARALNETNLATDRNWAITKGSDYFSATLYEGTAAQLDVDVGFDVTACLTVIKNRDQADSWVGVDTVRGATKELNFDSGNAESTVAEGVKAFGTVANNIRLGDDANGYNAGSESHVMYTWKEGVTPGFDILTYTGNGSNRTISHGLSAVPNFIVCKQRSDSNNWAVYHSGVASDPATDYLLIDGTNAAADDATLWQDTAPTSSVFSLGTAGFHNTDTKTYVAYLWADVPGFQKHGHYLGNGNVDGPFIYCGFRPASVVVKNVTQANHWTVQDTSRDPANAATKQTNWNSNVGENTGDVLDILSNGFKIRSIAGTQYNTAGNRYIFSAWAENPFPRSKAR
jgi:hypothetical protein